MAMVKIEIRAMLVKEQNPDIEAYEHITRKEHPAIIEHIRNAIRTALNKELLPDNIHVLEWGPHKDKAYDFDVRISYPFVVEGSFNKNKQ